MILSLGRNYFFRSCWSIKNKLILTETDIKYFDLDALNERTCEDWSFQPGSSERKHRVISTGKIDVSYWNTYILSGKFVGENIIRYYTVFDSDMYGTKNLRVDNMSDRQFFFFTSFEEKRDFNNDWKTAHLTEMPARQNPHWNLYKYRLREK
jgi:hypothetical protein